MQNYGNYRIANCGALFHVYHGYICESNLLTMRIDIAVIHKHIATMTSRFIKKWDRGRNIDGEDNICSRCDLEFVVTKKFKYAVS